MPKLKAALASHTANAQRAAAAKKAAANKYDKAASVKASVSGAKKAAKRRARKEAHAHAHGTAAGSASAPATGDDGSTTVGADERGEPSGQAVSTSKSAAATSASTSASVSASTSSASVRTAIPFNSKDTILLLGEANFSFALSIVTAHRHPGHQVLATSYDSEETCFHKYPDARDNVQRLRDAGAGVEFGVDGGRLEGCKKVGKGRWSRVIMNFPHTGSGIKDQDRNIRDNQLLLLRVLRSVAPVLTSGPASLLPNSHSGLKRKSKASKQAGGKNAKRRKAESSDDEDDDRDGAHGVAVGAEDVSDLEDENMDPEEGMDPAYLPSSTTTSTARELNPPDVPGTLLITLLDQPPYTLWALRQLATRPPASIPNAKAADRGPQPRYALVRSFQFVPAAYPGYAHRRTLGFKEGLSKDDNEEIVGRKGLPRTWEFALNPKTD